MRGDLDPSRVRRAHQDVRWVFGGAAFVLLVLPWIPFPWKPFVLAFLFVGGIFLKDLSLRRTTLDRASLATEWRALWGPPGAWTFLRALSRPQPRQTHLMERAARRGYLLAQVAYGELLWIGANGVKDPEGACRWFQMAAERGSLEAAARLGHALVWGVGMRRDPEGGRLWLRRAAQGGHPGARQILDRLEGRQEYGSETLGHPPLLWLLEPPQGPGRLELALGVFQHRALRWADRFWQARQREGRLGSALILVGGVAFLGLALVDPSLIQTLLFLGVYLAVLSPFLLILVRWTAGDRVLQGRERRQRHGVLARAEAGDTEACLALGRRYAQGDHGHPRDGAEAVRWLRLAAHGGQAEAMVLLGDLLAYGPEAIRNREEAWAWLERALALGHPEAEVRLSRMDVLR